MIRCKSNGRFHVSSMSPPCRFRVESVCVKFDFVKPPQIHFMAFHASTSLVPACQQQTKLICQSRVSCFKSNFWMSSPSPCSNSKFRNSSCVEFCFRKFLPNHLKIRNALNCRFKPHIQLDVTINRATTKYHKMPFTLDRKRYKNRSRESTRRSNSSSLVIRAAKTSG